MFVLLGLVPSLAEMKQLNSAEFEELLKQGKAVFGAYTQPWCGHCKALAPKFEELSGMIENVEVVKIDCSQDEEFCQKAGVRGYPTIKLFANGSAIDYDGSREAADMKFWIEAMFKPIMQVKTIEQLKAEAEKSGAVSFIYIETQKPEEFEKILSDFKGKVLVGYTQKAGEKLFIFREGVQIQFTEPLNKLTLSRFIQMHSIPFFTFIGPHNFGRTIHTGVPAVFLFGNREMLQERIDELQAYAKEMKVAAQFGFLQKDEMSDGLIQNELKMDASKPLLVTLGIQDGQLSKGGIEIDPLISVTSRVKEAIESMTKFEPPRQQESENGNKIVIIAITVAAIVIVTCIFCCCCRKGDEDNEEEVCNGETCKCNHEQCAATQEEEKVEEEHKEKETEKEPLINAQQAEEEAAKEPEVQEEKAPEPKPEVAEKEQEPAEEEPKEQKVKKVTGDKKGAQKRRAD